MDKYYNFGLTPFAVLKLNILLWDLLQFRVCSASGLFIQNRKFGNLFALKVIPV